MKFIFFKNKKKLPCHQTLKHKGKQCFVGMQAQISSEQTNTLSFCPRSCCSNLKQPQSGINIRMQACASPVGTRDAGGAGGAGGPGGVCRRDI